MQFNKNFLNQLDRVERNTESLQDRISRIEILMTRVDQKLRSLCHAIGFFTFILVIVLLAWVYL